MAFDFEGATECIIWLPWKQVLWKKYDKIILPRFVYYCSKFHTDTTNQTEFGKEFVKLVWGK